jgi:hypothetical protein
MKRDRACALLDVNAGVARRTDCATGQGPSHELADIIPVGRARNEAELGWTIDTAVRSALT